MKIIKMKSLYLLLDKMTYPVLEYGSKIYPQNGQKASQNQLAI